MIRCVKGLVFARVMRPSAIRRQVSENAGYARPRLFRIFGAINSMVAERANALRDILCSKHPEFVVACAPINGAWREQQRIAGS